MAALNSSAPLATGISEGLDTCHSPICTKRIEACKDGHWRRTERFFCSKECKQQASLIRRVAKLYGLSPEEMHRALTHDRKPSKAGAR